MHCYNLISRNSKTSFCASAAPCEQAPRWLSLAYAADSRNKYREPLRYDACIFNCSDAQLNMQEYRSGHNEAVLKTVRPKATGVRIPLPAPTKREHLSTDKCSLFVYPSRRLGISSRRSRVYHQGRNAPLYLITRQRAFSCGLMIYNTSC